MEENDLQFLDFKMQPPRVCRISILREGLLRELSLCQEQIIILRGAAGYGKTEAARQYCQGFEGRALWYSLDEFDNNEAALAMRLERLFALKIAGYQDNSLVNKRKEKISWESILARLFKALEQTGNGYVWVIDSFEQLEEPEDCPFWLCLFENLPESLQVVLTTRTPVPSFLSRFVINGDCRVYDETKLAFSSYESELLGKRFLDRAADWEMLEALMHDYLEGWPMGLVSFLACVRREGMEGLTFEYLFQRSMFFDFINCEIFERQPMEIREFLNKTALFPELNRSVCEKLFPELPCGRILTRLRREGLLIYSKEKTTLEYRKIFRCFLKREGERRIQEEMARKMLDIYLAEKEAEKKEKGQTVYCEAAELEDSLTVKKRLKACMFGDFRVYVPESGKHLPWRTRKGGEFFAYLIALNGKAVPRKKILAALWEEEQPSNAVTMLHNIIYNIRKELAPYHLAELIQYRDKMYHISADEVETDLGEIDRLCMMIERESVTELSRYSDRFKAYWGRYLDNIDSRWAEEQKEYYDVRFSQGCMLLAADAMERNCYRQALVYLKNALIINSYSEEVMVQILRCYGKMKNLKQVRDEYSRFCLLLERELGIGPGKELSACYRKILTTQEEEDEEKAMSAGEEAGE